jgi:DNA-binding response OmpR family regulator
MRIKRKIEAEETDRAVKTVLVVDDDPAVVRAMNVLMSRAGFQPIVCRTGADALDKAGAQISAAVVDIHLPDINGLTLSLQLRKKVGPDVPIVILSGDNSMDTLRALPDAGATCFFAKPVNGGRLIEHLKEWICNGKINE